MVWLSALQWRHNERDGVSNHQPHECLLNRLYKAQIKNINASRHWTLCDNSPGTGEFPAQMANNAENISIWWRHHEICGPFHICQTWSARPGYTSFQNQKERHTHGETCLFKTCLFSNLSFSTKWQAPPQILGGLIFGVVKALIAMAKIL